MSRCGKRFLIVLSFILLTLWNNKYVTAGGNYAAKAEQVYKFAVYVRWPENGKPLIFCVRGSQAFSNVLKQRLAKRSINGRKLSVGHSGCSIIVGISRSVRGGKGVLTISDAKGFAKNGGMIEFISANGKNFYINNTVAKRMGVRISAHLLKLAKDVY